MSGFERASKLFRSSTNDFEIIFNRFLRLRDAMTESISCERGMLLPYLFYKPHLTNTKVSTINREKIKAMALIGEARYEIELCCKTFVKQSVLIYITSSVMPKASGLVNGMLLQSMRT